MESGARTIWLERADEGASNGGGGGFVAHSRPAIVACAARATCRRVHPQAASSELGHKTSEEPKLSKMSFYYSS